MITALALTIAVLAAACLFAAFCILLAPFQHLIWPDVRRTRHDLGGAAVCLAGAAVLGLCFRITVLAGALS